MIKSESGIRSLRRGLAVLQVINRGGSVRMIDICQQADIPYPTAHRIVKSLISEGMIECEQGRKRYKPTALVRTLSYGYRAEERLISIARPHIVELCEDVNWPISLTTRVGNMMMVQDSTHSKTSLTFNNYQPGYTLPLLECSTGKAYLAFCEQRERATIVAGFDELGEHDAQMAQLLFKNDDFLDDIRQAGYATQARNLYTDNPGKTSSIAAPIFGHGKLQACVALVFFSSAIRMSDAEARFVEKLMQTAHAVGRDLTQTNAELGSSGEE